MHAHYLELGSLNKHCLYEVYRYLIVSSNRTEYNYYLKLLKNYLSYIEFKVINSVANVDNLKKGIYNNCGTLIYQDESDVLVQSFSQVFE